LVCS
jgi:hypothetical protein